MKEIKYLTIEEQIEHLKEKGLIINNEKRAKKYLEDIGYYKLINGYKSHFIVKIKDPVSGELTKKYIENTTIEEFYYIYEFDQKLRALILKNSSEIEVMVKSRISDLISQKYGIKESDYLQASNFKPDKPSDIQKKTTFIDIQKEISSTINKQKTKHNSIMWYAQNYGFFPFWVISNILTFGTISLLYSKMLQPDQNCISKTFNLKPKTFESLLMVLHLFRNACAHNEVIYNYRTNNYHLSQKYLENIYNSYNIPIDESTGRFIYGTNDIFCIVIIFKLLLSKSQFNEFVQQFNSFLNRLKKHIDIFKYNEILKTMGIVDDLSIIHKLKI